MLEHETALRRETWVEWIPSYDDYGKVEMSHEEFDMLADFVASYRARHPRG